jgi:LacI family transcriptional regulator
MKVPLVPENNLLQTFANTSNVFCYSFVLRFCQWDLQTFVMGCISMRSVSITKIANQLGISPSTVSRALNDKYGVNPATKEKVLEAAQQLGYVPNEMARELVSGKSQLVGIVLAEIGPEQRPPLFELVPDMNQTLEGLGYETIIRFFAPDTYATGDLDRLCRRRHIEGVLVLPGFGAKHQISRDAASSETPCVVLGEDVLGTHCSSMGTDEIAGLQFAVAHLAAFGHRNIGFVNGPEGVTICRQRLEGYTKGLRDAGLPVKSEYIIHSDFSAPGGANAALALKSRAPEITAMCFANDMMALGAVSQFQMHQVSIPEDLSIVGYDNIYPIAYINPPLTSIAHNRGVGTRCAELLYEMMQGAAGRQEFLAPKLIARDSVAPCDPLKRRATQRPT